MRIYIVSAGHIVFGIYRSLAAAQRRVAELRVGVEWYPPPMINHNCDCRGCVLGREHAIHYAQNFARWGKIHD